MKLSIYIAILCTLPAALSGQLWKGDVGKVSFLSDAPLERIEAGSNELKAVLNTEEQTFAFSIRTISFLGFNSPLQQQHFNENYLETDIFPRSTFTGKIIEDVNFSVPGTYEVRAKGNLTIHGVTRERIIKGKLFVTADSIRISSDFMVLLEEHDIEVPKIVNQKIAQEIQVSMEIELRPE